MTDHEKRLVLRGMSLARGVLKRVGCPERFHKQVRDYQEIMAEAWNFDVNTEAGKQETIEFEILLTEINDAIAAKHPDWLNARGEKWRRQ